MSNEPQTRCLLTVDTECRAGGWPKHPDAAPKGYESMMLGKIGNKHYGLRYITETLERCSLVGEFFIEPFCSYKLGLSTLRDICQEVLERGHGVSLHLHPRWKLALNPHLRCMSDSMHDYTLDEQTALLREGLELFDNCGVNNVFAFRCGNLAGNFETYEALRRVGIPISSNFCGAWNAEITARYRLPRELNDAVVLDGIVEIPITSFHDFPVSRPNHLRPLQIAAASQTEFTTIFKDSIQKKVRFVVVLFHTFEWLSLQTAGHQVVSKRILARFHHVCEWLAGHHDCIRVCRFSDISVPQLREDIQAIAGEATYSFQSNDVAGAKRWLEHAAAKCLRRSVAGW